MISLVRGVVLQRTAVGVIVDVHGIGLQITCTPRALSASAVGRECTLHTSLVIREDQWQLFGFVDTAERDAFQLLQSVTGIGPRIALAAVSTLDPERIAQAIVSDDVDVLTKIPGIGKKGAARMCVELKDRFGAAVVSDGWRASVRDALVGLGWSASQAEGAVDAVASEHGNPEVADALRFALQLLGRR